MPPMGPMNKLSGPPPGSTPQGLTSMIPQGGFQETDLPESKPASGGEEGGLKDVFDEIQSVLDSLASILPEQAEEIDGIKTQLSEVLAKAISGGASFQGSSQQGEQIKTPATSGIPV